jgi:Zn-dependent protease
MTLDILSIFAAIALHEFAHVIAALCPGVKVKRFGLCWRGVYIVREAGSDWQNLVISLAGPLSNLAAAYVSLAVFHRGAIFCAMNLVIGCINLLPLPAATGCAHTSCWCGWLVLACRPDSREGLLPWLNTTRSIQ